MYPVSGAGDTMFTACRAYWIRLKGEEDKVDLRHYDEDHVYFWNKDKLYLFLKASAKRSCFQKGNISTCKWFSSDVNIQMWARDEETQPLQSSTIDIFHWSLIYLSSCSARPRKNIEYAVPNVIGTMTIRSERAPSEYNATSQSRYEVRHLIEGFSNLIQSDL